MIQPTGYIRLWRELLSKPIWLNSTPEQKIILITLLAMANWKENKWEWNSEQYTCEKGQFITSLDSIVKNCGQGISVQNVRTALKRFENFEFLTSASTNTGRLITIVNWEVYQSPEENQQTSQQAPNKHLTSSQQAPNKHLTTIEEVKKVKKVKKLRNNIGDFSLLDDFSEDLKTAYLDFADMRKLLKKPMTEKAFKMLINKVDSMASDEQHKIALLKQSILNSWQSVYPLKDNGKGGSNGVNRGANGKDDKYADYEPIKM